MNYKLYLKNGGFGVKRAILGYEQSGANDQGGHIQGYIEFIRSRRFNFVRGIFVDAHWQRAVGSPKQNYDYCAKGKLFDTIGDWTAEQTDTSQHSATGTIIRGLLSKYAPQVKCSKDYMFRKREYDDAAKLVATIQIQHANYDKFKNSKLSNWQFEVFNLLKNQSERKVLWVVDEQGDKGKTWFSKFMMYMYNYFVCDGTLDCRDLCYILPDKFHGIIFDLCRTMQSEFKYTVLESVKNGHVMSGKYEGKQRIFDPVPVAVLANFLPDVSKLSADRWEIIELGSGQYINANKVGLHDVQAILPYVQPPIMPELFKNVNILNFLNEKLPGGPDGSTRPIPIGK